MKVVPRKVLVTSVGSGIGYGVLYALRRADRAYRMIGANASSVAAGIFRCDSLYHIPPASQSDEYKSSLSEIVQNERPQMLIPGHDEELLSLSSWRDMLESAHDMRVLVSSPEVARVCYDKLASALFFGKRFAATASTAEEIERLVSSLGFPLIVKRRHGYASKGVSVVFDQVELNTALANGSDGLIVQDFLVPASWGKDKHELTRQDVYDNGVLRQDEEYSVQVMVGNGGEILGLFSSRNTLWHGAPFTIETFRDSVLEKLVLEMVEKLVSIGLIGPCNFQARRTPEGEYVFFEVNSRFTGITPVRADMGFNECDVAFRHFVNNEKCGKDLKCREGLIAQRYITHDIFSRSDVRVLESEGRWHASI